MSASWDSDLSSIIEKTNNNLKLLRKIGDKPQARADVSVTGPPTFAHTGSLSGSVSSHSSAHPRAFVGAGASDDAGSVGSRSSARPKAFVRGDDDSSSMGSHSSARPKAYIRGDDDSGSMGSRSPARLKAFVRADDDNNSLDSRASSARPKVYVGDDGTGSVSSRSSARPKAFIRLDDDSGSVSSRASARPKAFIRGDDDAGSVSSRASARPKAFIRGDDDAGSVSSRASARPKAFIRGDDDAGSMSSNQGLGRARLDSSHGSVSSSSSRPHVGIAGGGGLTAAMLQQHRATSGGGNLAMADLGPRPRYDLDETRSMTGSTSGSRLNRRIGATGRVPHARPLGASMGPRIRVAESDIPSDIPSHVVDEIKKSLETQFASRNSSVDKKVADLRTDVSGLSTQTASLTSQMAQLRETMLTPAATSAAAPGAVADPKIIANVQANAAAISRLEEHSADLLGRKVTVDRQISELGSRVKAMSSAMMKISTLEDNVEALVGVRAKHEQAIDKVWNKVQLMHRQMGSLVDMKAVENLLSIRLTREFREMEDRMSQNVARMAEKMEQKVQSLEKQALSQRQESLATLKSDLTDDIQRLQSSALRKSDLLPLQNAQSQSKEELAQLSGALDRQEKKLQDTKVANATLRDELVDARAELNKALLSQQRSASAIMEEKLEQIANSNKDKTSKIDDHLAELAKKQKKLEESTKVLQETMVQVKIEANQRLSRTSADREEENDKLRQRLARSVAELEALATTKAEVERRFANEEQQFQARLKELRTSLTETEKQKESQRLELMQKLQEESKLMGVAQGKNTLLESLLAREKSENEEKNELVRKSKKEVAEVREQIRSLEAEKEKKVRQLTSELQAKQTQVGLLTKTLKRIETASAKMLDLSKREAKTVRRVKATKEHELFIAQLKLKEMERVAQALQNGDEMKKQAALTAASTEERNELEKLLLESQLEKDELKQELHEMTEEFNAAKESQKVIMEDTITKLSSDYDEKISELKQQIADKEQAMRLLRDTLVEKSNLDALEDELTSLKDEKNDLLEQMQRAQIEHERVVLKTETNLRLEHATEFSTMKSKLEERISELEGVRNELEATKAKIAELESEMEKQEALHQREVSTLTLEIKEARSKIDECTAQILTLEETKARLEGDISQMEANIGGASAEREEQLAAIKSDMQAEVDKLRAELQEVTSSLEENQTKLKNAKQSDEANRQKLVEMAMAQEEMQGRYVAQIDSLTLKLNQERESSRSREQELEESIDKLNADIKTLKAEASNELEASRSELTEQMSELTTTLKGSQNREQQLQSRLKRILEELVQAANASGDGEVSEDASVSDDDSAITHHLDALYATHRRTAHELERLQAEYDLTVKQAAADSATAQELDSQVKEHVTQIRDLESVVEQLREELKEQYHKSAVLAKGSDEFSDEMISLREEKRELERQLKEEERDREKREVSYQRRTEVKERELEELREENKAFSAAVASIRKKIQSVENAKSQDLDELTEQLKDLEDRTAALQPNEDNAASMEKDFTATRQEIVALTGEVQSLYQKLTACCGIMEWTELRASVFDEEEKLTRVRTESARELAKVESVEQEVLMNAEFLNALLVAHGSTGGDGSLLNDFRWMQKYASIAPEIVEKLRKVESRLRDAVLDLHDGSTSLFSDAAPASNTSSVGGSKQAPASQNSSVSGAAIALALEKAKQDYFSESSENADELEKHDVDQPDIEHEGEEQENSVGEGAGANSDHVDVAEQGLSGEISHSEPDTCDGLEIAEHIVHAEQERSYEEQGATSLAMSGLEGEGSRIDAAVGSVTNKQDRRSDDGWTPSVDRAVGMAKNEDEEVERLVLEQSSSTQLHLRLGGEVGGGGGGTHSAMVDDEVGDKSSGDTVLAKHGDVISSCMKNDSMGLQQTVVSLDDCDSGEGSFGVESDGKAISNAGGGAKISQPEMRDGELDESCGADDYSLAENSFDEAMRSGDTGDLATLPGDSDAANSDSSDAQPRATQRDGLFEANLRSDSEDSSALSEEDVSFRAEEENALEVSYSTVQPQAKTLPTTIRPIGDLLAKLSDGDENYSSRAEHEEVDMQSEHSDEAVEIAALSSLPVKIQEGAAEPSEVQLRSAESLYHHSALALDDDNEARMRFRMGQEQESLFDNNLSLLRLRMEEGQKSLFDDALYQIEDDNESLFDNDHLALKNRAQHSRSTLLTGPLQVEQGSDNSKEEETTTVNNTTSHLWSGDDDEFGETSLPLHGGDEGVAAATSVRSQPRTELRSALHRSHDDEEEFGESSVRSGEDDEFGETSLQSRDGDDAPVGSAAIRAQTRTDLRAAVNRSHDEDEFGEASIRSGDDDEFGETSLPLHGGDEGVAAATSVRSQPRTELRSALHRSHDDEEEFGESSVRSGEDDEFGETSLQSRDGDDAPVGSAAIRAQTRTDLRAAVNRSHDEDEFGEASIRSGDDDEFGETSLPLHGGDEGVAAATSVRSQPRTELRSALHRSHDDEEEFGESSVRSGEDDEFGETSLQSRDGDDAPVGSAAIRAQTRTDLRAAVNRSHDEDEFGEASIRSGDDDEFGETSLPLHGGDEGVAAATSVRSQPRTELRSALHRSHDDEEEFGESSVRSGEDDEFGETSLQSRDGDDAPVGSAAIRAQTRTDLRAAVNRSHDEDEFGEASIRSGDDDEFGETSLPLHGGDEGVAAATSVRSQPRTELRSALHRSHDDEEEFGESSVRSGEDDEFGETSLQSRDGDDAPVGSAAIRAQTRTDLRAAVNRSHDEDEFGEASIRSGDDDEFGETSLPLHGGDEGVAAATSVRSQPRTELRSALHRSHDDEEEFGESSVRSGEDDEFGETSLQSRDGDDAPVGSAAIRAQTRTDLRAAVNRSHDEDEFGEASIRSGDDDEFGETSLPLHGGDEGVAAATSVRSQPRTELRSALHRSHDDEEEFGESSVRSGEDDEFGETSLQSRDGDDAPVGSAAIRAQTRTDLRAAVNRSHDEDEFGEASIRSGDDDEFGETSLPLHGGDEGVAAATSVRSQPRTELRSALHRSHDDEEEFGESSVRSGEDDEFGETSLQSRDGDDAPVGSAAIRAQTRTDLRAAVNRSHDEDEFGEASIRSGDDDEFGETSLPLHGGDEGVAAATSVRSQPRTELRSALHRSHDDEEEFGESSVRSGEDDEFGETSLQSRDGDDAPVGSAAIRAQTRTDLRAAVNRSHDEDEFGEASIRSGDDDEFGETSLPLHGGDEGVAAATSVRSQPRTELRSALHRSHDDEEEFGESSVRSGEDDEFGETSLQSRDGDDAPVGSAAIRAQTRTDLRAAVNRSHDEDEFGEASIRSGDDDEFGETSLPLHGGDEGVAAATSVRSQPRTELRSALHRSYDVGDEVGVASLQSRSDSSGEFIEKSIRNADRRYGDEDIGADLGKSSHDEVGRLLLEYSALNTANQPRQNLYNKFNRSFVDDGDVELGESSLQSRGDDDDDFDEISIPMRVESGVETTSTGYRSRGEFDTGRISSLSNKLASRSDDFSETSVQSHESNEFGDEDEIERLLLEHSDAHAKLQQKGALNISRFTRRYTDDDDNEVEFGETSLQSRGGHDDEFGETSLSKADDEFEKLTRLQEDDDFGVTSIQSRDEDEFGEASTGSRNEERANLAPSSHSHAAVQPPGNPISSHVRLTSNTVPAIRLDDSISDTEQDYLDDSFDASSPVRPAITATTTANTLDESADDDYLEESFDLEESLADDD